jgi:hypothetical protein
MAFDCCGISVTRRFAIAASIATAIAASKRIPSLRQESVD